MAGKSSFALKFLQWINRGVQLLCATVILGIYAYFLATLSNHDLKITNQNRAVTGISGIAIVYALIGLLLLCCLAGHTFFSFIAIVLDIAFIAAFIYVAVANRGGAGTCDGIVDTPFGRGQSNSDVQGNDGFTHLPSFHTACRLQTACLAVAIIAIFFYIFSILTEIFIARHHRKEKRFGPSPQNNYTKGYGRRPGMFGRFFRGRKDPDTFDESALPEHTHPDQLEPMRPSYGTENTAVNDGQAYGGNPYKSEHGYGYPSTQEQGYTRYEMPGSQPTQQYRYGDGVYDRA